ncbi:hypothetical protein Kpol_1051p43 [Vanderwaltozyma polyspora DSM 70294]|uniref:FAR-17a/AIG1-like protein n=1 Tax=Vanderwaltozyma polyspora (strain ATCC 22028 / DSM 70294 / BCRC 21397 / CBS 2163 / NBRC 10782 / NRRL Y-8283 / UCD 57-17) TaxID=436907 RepID=A7TN04_VANPO|nr:uncharacterized protein Kpol_1051p43 [Vanderwaltozyma polyspora DSM 70294]EDO16392.1 hypothetical protein Kpol_1051p43 [Vanderwaltozyma polyspora DSM 70294]
MPVRTLPPISSLILNNLSILIVGWGLNQGTQIKLPASLRDAGHKQFLTNISVIATLICSIVNATNYFVQRDIEVFSNHFKQKFNHFSRHVFLPIALVMETLVPVVYWPLRLFARHLIMQDVPDNIRNPIPISVDLAIHLFPTIFLFSDHYFTGYGSRFEITNQRAWLMVTVLGVGYNRWLYYLIDLSKGQAFPYPFLGVAEPYRSLTFLSLTSFTWVLFWMYQKFPPKTTTPKQKVN